MAKILHWLIFNIFRFRWIEVLTDPEYGTCEGGFRVFGHNFTYYKYNNSAIIYDRHDDGTPVRWRYANKRAFGEVIHSKW